MTKDEMIILLIEEIKKMSVDESVDLNVENAGKIIIEQLQIDSLEAIEWAMNLEIRLGIEFEIAGFAKTATLDELAIYKNISTLYQYKECDIRNCLDTNNKSIYKSLEECNKNTIFKKKPFYLPRLFV